MPRLVGVLLVIVIFFASDASSVIWMTCFWEGISFTGRGSGLLSYPAVIRKDWLMWSCLCSLLLFGSPWVPPTLLILTQVYRFERLVRSETSFG